jgi:hypothetical protein
MAAKIFKVYRRNIFHRSSSDLGTNDTTDPQHQSSSIVDIGQLIDLFLLSLAHLLYLPYPSEGLKAKNKRMQPCIAHLRVGPLRQSEALCVMGDEKKAREYRE